MWYMRQLQQESDNVKNYEVIFPLYSSKDVGTMRSYIL